MPVLCIVATKQENDTGESNLGKLCVHIGPVQKLSHQVNWASNFRGHIFFLKKILLVFHKQIKFVWFFNYILLSGDYFNKF